MGTLLDDNIQNKEYIVNGGEEGFKSDDTYFSVSSESLKKLDQVNKLHSAYFKKREKYKILKEYSPDHPDCLKLKKECSRIAAKSRKLLTQI